jgi:non-homologous end joining protein Ku
MHTQSINKVVAPKSYYLLFDIKTTKVYTKLEAMVQNANNVAFARQALG